MDVNLPRINLLAESYYWKNKTCLQIKLREGIHFHDSTLFNASAAKWNLDRLLYLTNCTGNNTGAVAYTQVLWMFPEDYFKRSLWTFLEHVIIYKCWNDLTNSS